MVKKQSRMKLLNQYTSRTVPGFVNVLGTATNTATVSLWSQDNLALYTPTTRQGDYFRGEMLVNNNTGAVWLTITSVAALSNHIGADIVTNIAGNLLLAQNPETFIYDADGNLTSDGLWTNVWNGENRRITVEIRSTLPAAGKVKEAWTILADGRWIERIVSTNNGTSYYPSQTNRYVWDHQVLLAVLDHTNGVLVSFMRGIDMSGSIQGAGGAGGVGGVLAVQVGPAGPAGLAGTTHFTCYDGNGNVMALINAATGAESAHYEYGPFAEPLRITGPMAKLNPIRFSTQYYDDYTGDDKYLFRDLRDGRWPSRDPIAERGGLNLYGFVANNPISRIDRLGLQFMPSHGWPSEPNKGSCNLSGLLRKCCPDKCNADDDIQLVDVEVKFLPPHMTPESEENTRIKMSQLGSLETAATLVQEVVSCGLYAGIAGTIASGSMDWKHELMEGMLNKTISRQLDQNGAITYTKLVYKRCRLERCFFVGPKRLNWSSTFTTDPWRPCSLGALPSLGYYSGLQEATDKLPSCIEAHVKAEFSR